MRISDWSSDVCSSDLIERVMRLPEIGRHRIGIVEISEARRRPRRPRVEHILRQRFDMLALLGRRVGPREGVVDKADRSEEHTSELQSLMRISYAVFCLQKKNTIKNTKSSIITM